MPSQYLKQAGYIRAFEIAAVVDGWENGYLITTQRNRFFPGQEMEALEPCGKPFRFVPEALFDADMQPLESANHPMMRVYIPYPTPLKEGTLLRFDKQI